MKSVKTAMCHRSFCKVSMKHIPVKPLKGGALQSPCPLLLKLKGNKIPNLLYPPPSRAARYHHQHLLHSPWPQALLPPPCKQLHGPTLPYAVVEGSSVVGVVLSLSADPLFVGIL